MPTQQRQILRKMRRVKRLKQQISSLQIHMTILLALVRQIKALA